MIMARCRSIELMVSNPICAHTGAAPESDVHGRALEWAKSEYSEAADLRVLRDHAARVVERLLF